MGTETFAENLSLHAGGGAFITSAAFSALGWQTALLATVPAAPFDGIVLDDIEKFGVDTRHCVKAEMTSAPQITVAITGEDDRAFLSHKTGNAFPDIQLADLGISHLHVGELRSLLEHPSLIEKAKAEGMTISVDCGWDVELLSQIPEVTRLLHLVDVFLPNEVEFENLRKAGLRESCASLIVVKCGAAGAKASADGAWVSQPTSRKKVVDATGAGDAFNGGFLSSWLSGKALKDCLANGNQCGGYSVEHVGGTGGLMALRNDLDASQIGAAQ